MRGELGDARLCQPYYRPVAKKRLQSPVIVDGDIREEKVAELLALEAEYPELDFKRMIDLGSPGGPVELAKDIGAMQVLGGYILVGADDRGRIADDMDQVDLRPFDQASLQQKMLKYLPHPGGCAFFRITGAYAKDDGTVKTVFEEGEVFWRDGTSSTRMNQEGLEEVIERRVERAKDDWMAEQQEIRRREREDLESARQGRELGEGPLGSVDLDLPARELSLTALDLIRRDDEIALQHLINDAVRRAQTIIDQEGDVESNLADVLDKLICLAATLLEYDQEPWFDKVIAILVQIYGMKVTTDQVRMYGYSGNIPSTEIPPRVWLAILERVFALGGLAVRLEKWTAIKKLTLQLPDVIAANDYDQNWLRHGLTMASRARQFEREAEQLSLLSLAKTKAADLECLRSDGVGPEDDVLLTSIAQFDLLSNVTAIDAAVDLDAGRVFYPNFARVYQERVQPIANRLVSDPTLRAAIFRHDDDRLATALNEIGEIAKSEGWRYDGFHGWDGTPVGEFIAEHLPRDDVPYRSN
jgi:hypothetical protein